MHKLRFTRRHSLGSASGVAGAIVDSNYVALVAINRSRRIMHWNRGAERFYGWKSCEVVGRSIELIVPPSRRAEYNAMLAALQRGEECAPVETKQKHKRGHELLVHLHMSPMLDDDGEFVGVSTVALDSAHRAAARVVVRPADRGAFEASWHDGRAHNEAFALPDHIPHEAGESRDCEGTVTPVHDMVGRVERVAAFRDTRPRHLAEGRERHNADRWRQIFDANVFGICYGVGYRILDANDVLLDMLGVERQSLDADAMRPDRLLAGVDFVAMVASVETSDACECEIERPDGSTACLLVSVVGDVDGWVAVAVDLTERKNAERAVEYRALHDELTGVPNRRLLIDRIEHALLRARRLGARVGLLFCDLDNFKAINDVYGHACGDDTLRVVASRLQSAMRDSDTVARMGGDEFVVVLEEMTTADDAVRIAERVRRALAMPIEFDGQRLDVTCSIGVSVSESNDERFDTLLNRADAAMYSAKANGRDRASLLRAESPILEEPAEVRAPGLSYVNPRFA